MGADRQRKTKLGVVSMGQHDIQAIQTKSSFHNSVKATINNMDAIEISRPLTGFPKSWHMFAMNCCGGVRASVAQNTIALTTGLLHCRSANHLLGLSQSSRRRSTAVFSLVDGISYKQSKHLKPSLVSCQCSQLAQHDGPTRGLRLPIQLPAMRQLRPHPSSSFLP